MTYPNEGDRKDCPLCGEVAVFSTQVAVIVLEGKTVKNREPGPDAIYGHGWACSNGSCDFSEQLPSDVPS